MGIKHFNQLSAKRKQEFFDNPENFYANEKIDGSNFLFGRENGRLWAARKTVKERYWSPNDWPTDMWAQNFRLAHKAVASVFGMIDTGCTGDTALWMNFSAEAEILSPHFANTLLYEGDFTWIVVYKCDAQLPPFILDEFDDIRTSHDGRTIVSQPFASMFRLCMLEHATFDIVKLSQECKVVPEEKQYDRMIDWLRDEVSDFGKTRPEGFVFTHKTAGWAFKVVDTEWFTKMNNENYEFRRRLFKTPYQRSNSVMDVYTRNIAQGMDKAVAASLALDEVNKLHHAYFNEGLSQGLPEHVHNRNVEALASLYQQLQGVL